MPYIPTLPTHSCSVPYSNFDKDTKLAKKNLAHTLPPCHTTPGLHPMHVPELSVQATNTCKISIMPTVTPDLARLRCYY